MTFAHERAQDFLRLLDEDAEFRHAVRQHLLTADLIELPERFAQQAAYMDAFVKRVDDFINRQEQFNDSTIAFINRQEQFNNRQEQFNDSAIASMNRLRDDVGELKGNIARHIVSVQFEQIAEQLGLRFTDLLIRPQLVAILSNVSRSTVSIPDRQSFYRSDLVFEAADPSGQKRYVTVEASYTADARDIQRALRHAEILTQVTGQPATPVIASVRNDDNIGADIQSRIIQWYPLDPNDFRPD